MIKIELKRAFANRAYLLALCIGLGIVIWHLFIEVIPLSKDYDMYYQQILTMTDNVYPSTVFRDWFGSSMHHYSIVGSNLFFFILPLLICIPYVGSYYSDRSSGYAANVVVRTKSSKYYTAKLLAIFLSAASIAVIPLVFSLFVASLFIPAIVPEVTTFSYPIVVKNFWADIFYNAPALYFALYFTLIAVTTGLLALLGAVIAHFVGHVLFSLLTPFAVCTFYSYLLGAFSLSHYSPTAFMRPTQPLAPDLAWVLFTVAVLAIGQGIFFFLKLRKAEHY